MVLFCLCTITFFLIRFVPGGPFDQERGLSQESEQVLRKFYGYDKPLYQQYATYLRHLAQGDLGWSMRYPGYSVNQLLKERIPVSIELGFLSMMVAVIIGGLIGIVATIYHGTWIDRCLMGACLFCLSLPTFVLGPIVILIFSLKLDWFQATGWERLSDRVLPTIALACMYSGYIARLMRAACLDIIGQPFIRTAQAKGLGRLRIFIFHVLKNAVTPLLNYLGPTTAAIMSGSLVIESIFQIPGAGSLFISAVAQRDTPLLLGTVLYFAVLILCFNLLVDLAVVICNPRQRLMS